MVRMVAPILRSLYRSASSVAVNKQLLSLPPRQRYSTGAARTTVSVLLAKNLSSGCYYGSSFSGCLGSRRLLHAKMTNECIRDTVERIQVDIPDELEKYAFQMFDELTEEGLADEANQLFGRYLQQKRANVPAVAILTYLMKALIYNGYIDMAIDVYRYMLASGVTPSTLTYRLLIWEVSQAAWSDSNVDSKLVGVAKECFVDMLDKGRKPDTAVFGRLFANIAWLETVEEVRGFLKLIKGKGYVPGEDFYDIEKEKLEDVINLINLHMYFEMIADEDIKRVYYNDWFMQGTAKQAVFVQNMFKALLDDGNKDEVRMLFDKQFRPVALYTGVIETLINAGKTKGALEVYQRMLDEGYAPYSYTYSVLIKALAADPCFFADAKKYFLEMMEKGLRPNAATYAAVFEGFARQEDNAAMEEGRKFVKVMMGKGFAPCTEDVMKVLKGKPEPSVTRVMNIISSKWNY